MKYENESDPGEIDTNVAALEHITRLAVAYTSDMRWALKTAQDYEVGIDEDVQTLIAVAYTDARAILDMVRSETKILTDSRVAS